MPRICFVLIAGLDQTLLGRAGGLATLSSLPHRAAFQPPFPAVTSTLQATFTTGTLPQTHGIYCNGLYTHNQPDLQKQLDLTNHAASRVQVSFWEQANSLLNVPRFWKAAGKKTAMLFWQNSMPSAQGPAAADIVLTPKPTHTPDGKTLTACWSNPADLYPTLVQQLGPFPLHNYWSPMAALPSSQWIARASQHVWQHLAPDLQLIYIPHMDYNLQRLGPNHPAILKDLADVDALLAPLAAQVRAAGDTLILAGDYGMSEVNTPILLNLILRRSTLLITKPDAEGKLLVDYEQSQAFVMADHQAAFLFAKQDAKGIAEQLQKYTAGAFEIVADPQPAVTGLSVVPLRAAPNAWFVHDWWESDVEKPKWQFGVDIHNKPGYDPRELFFDPARKCIAQDPALVKGSHGRTDNPAQHPVVLSDAHLPANLSATAIAPWLAQLLAKQPTS